MVGTKLGRSGKKTILDCKTTSSADGKIKEFAAKFSKKWKNYWRVIIRLFKSNLLKEQWKMSMMK